MKRRIKSILKQRWRKGNIEGSVWVKPDTFPPSRGSSVGLTWWRPCPPAYSSTLVVSLPQYWMKLLKINHLSNRRSLDVFLTCYKIASVYLKPAVCSLHSLWISSSIRSSSRVLFHWIHTLTGTHKSTALRRDLDTLLTARCSTQEQDEKNCCVLSTTSTQGTHRTWRWLRCAILPYWFSARSICSPCWKEHVSFVVWKMNPSCSFNAK